MEVEILKKSFFILAAALIAVGAVCMSYGSYWAFDVLGFAVMAAGCAIGTVYAVKTADKKVLTAALCMLYLALVLLTVAGAVLFAGSILFAIMGAAAFAVFGFLIRFK